MRAQPEAVFRHDVILITINRSAQKNISMYDAVRSAWKLDPKRAEKQDYVTGGGARRHCRCVRGGYVAAGRSEAFPPDGQRGTGPLGI